MQSFVDFLQEYLPVRSFGEFSNNDSGGCTPVYGNPPEYSDSLYKNADCWQSYNYNLPECVRVRAQTKAQYEKISEALAGKYRIGYDCPSSVGETPNGEYADQIYCTGNEGSYDGQNTYWISNARAGCKVNDKGKEMPYGRLISKEEYLNPACSGWGCGMNVNNPEPDRSNQFCAAFNTTTNQCLQYQDMPRPSLDNSLTPCGWSYSENGDYVPCGEGYTCQSDPNIQDAAYCVKDDPTQDYDPSQDYDNEYEDPEDYNFDPDDDYYLDPCERDGDCGNDEPIKIYDAPMVEDDCGWRGRNPDGGGCFETYYDPVALMKPPVDYDALDAAKRDSDGYLLTNSTPIEFAIRTANPNTIVNQPVYDAPMVKDAPLKDFYNTDTTGEDNFVPLLGEQEAYEDGVAPVNPCAGTMCIKLYKPCPEGYIDGNKCCPNTGNCIPDPNYVGTIKPVLPIGQTPSTQFDQTTPIAIAQQTYVNTPIATRGDSSGFIGTDTTILRNTTTPALTETPTTAPVAAIEKDSPLAIAALLFLAFEVLG